jgi:hypothetical protein
MMKASTGQQVTAAIALAQQDLQPAQEPLNHEVPNIPIVAAQEDQPAQVGSETLQEISVAD